jgi:hypothetical protein
MEKKNFDKSYCANEALKYTKRIDFGKNSPTACKYARNNGWMNEICSHMKEIIKPNNYWDYENCKCEALKYKSRGEFRAKSSGAYSSARLNNWLNEICSHMIGRTNPKGYWTIERCRNIALKYNTKKDFATYDKTAYKMAHKRIWIDEICSHMEVLGDKLFRCVYSYEFPDNSVYVGLTCNLSERNEERKKNKRDQVTKHISETNLVPKMKKLTSYIPVKEASNLEIFHIEKYKREGWNVLNKIKGGGTGGGHLIWTFDKVKEAATNYNKIGEFRNDYGGAYHSAWKNGWLKLFFKKV